MESFEYHPLDPEPFKQFLSDPERKRMERLGWIILGITAVILAGGIVIYVIEMRKIEKDTPSF